MYEIYFAGFDTRGSCNWDRPKLLTVQRGQVHNSCRGIMPPVSLTLSISVIPPFAAGEPRLDAVGSSKVAGQRVIPLMASMLPSVRGKASDM